jgi:hypothetical protein
VHPCVGRGVTFSVCVWFQFVRYKRQCPTFKIHSLREICSMQIHFVSSTESGCFTTIGSRWSFWAKPFQEADTVMCLHNIDQLVAVEIDGRRFKSCGPLGFLRLFLLRNAPADNHQLVAEDVMEDETISRISNAYSLRWGRWLPTTTEVEELQFVIVIVMWRRKIKPHHLGGKLKKTLKT